MKNIAFVVLLVFVAFLFMRQTQQGKPIVVADLLKKNPGVVVDVRTKEDWNSGHVKEALHYDWNNGDFKRQCSQFDKNKKYYLYCAAGGRSSAAMQYMKSIGFKDVVNLGGYNNLK